ncbi:MAG: PD40 domain-containing protein [Acidobacteria bacterium]|nr:PD40 domain-containing protein [Acidobacteriota bacterium]
MLSDEAAASDPAWSGDGRTVLFEAGEGETRELRSVDVASGATRLVAPLWDGESALLRPRLSPDGTKMAYTRSRDAQLEVWVESLLDGQRWRVARLGDGAAFPIWSPDGRSLAVDVWHDGHAQVQVVDTDGAAHRQVSRGVDLAWVRSWAPDGSRLAFAGAVDGRWNVWWASRDGTRQAQLTDYRDEHHYVRNPAWSPRGRPGGLRVRQLYWQHLDRTAAMSSARQGPQHPRRHEPFEA